MRNISKSDVKKSNVAADERDVVEEYPKHPVDN